MAQTKTNPKARNQKRSKLKITVFHCFNAINSTAFLDNEAAEFSEVKMPCSSMIREVHLLRAFEGGADMVIVLACPEGNCHYVEGNLRAKKRVARVKKLLDEIGIGGNRLDLYNVPVQDEAAAEKVIRGALTGVEP